MKDASSLLEQAKAVLAMNDAGTHTRPAPDLYPHQWLWDSAFIAIGLARYNPQRAAQEIYSLLRGQWSNGMVPHMIFAEGKEDTSGRGHNLDGYFWQSHRSPHAPTNLQTSGITQPPMLAEACLRIAKAMNKAEADAFLRQVYPRLVAHHRWLYRERDPDSNGLVSLFHPWETGFDNTPGWMEELERVHSPFWIKAIEELQLDWIIEHVLRRDIKKIAADERMTTANALRLTHVAWGLRKRNYENALIMRRPHFLIESLSFNCILIGNNRALTEIAQILDLDIPQDLKTAFLQARHGLQSLWSEEDQAFYHRNYLTGELVPITGIARLLPLYAGVIPHSQAEKIVTLLNDPAQFLSTFPVPSVALNSPHYNPRKYWQGPTWINTNWLLVQGLRHYNFTNEANTIRAASIELFRQNGSFEYFSPESGQGLGADNFSWTAALIIDLLSE